MNGPVYCGRCGEPGHETRPSLDDRFPLVKHGRGVLIAGTRDLEESLRIRAAYRLELAAKAAAKAARP